MPKGDDNKIQALIERYQQRFGLDSSRSDAYSDVADHLTDELQANGISSGGTSRAQAEFAAKHPQIAELQLRGEAVLKEVGQAGLVGGADGGRLGGTFSAIHQAMRLSQGETTATSGADHHQGNCLRCRPGWIRSGRLTLDRHHRQGGWHRSGAG